MRGLLGGVFSSRAGTELGADVPIDAGIIVMWGGLVANIPAGWALCDGTLGTPDLRDRFIKGAAAGQNPGATGGAATHTPTGTVSQPTFTGSALGTHSHGAGTYGTAAITAGTPAGSIAWPAGVPTHSGTAATFAGSALAGHAHELPLQIPTATTIRQIAVAAFGTGTARAATAVSAAGTANTTSAAVALSQSVSAGTPAGTVTITNQGTIAWPAGVPAFSGAALGTHNHTFSGTSSADSAGTPAGTVSQPTFTGDSQNTEPAYYALAFIQKQ